MTVSAASGVGDFKVTIPTTDTEGNTAIAALVDDIQRAIDEELSGEALAELDLGGDIVAGVANGHITIAAAPGSRIESLSIAAATELGFAEEQKLEDANNAYPAGPVSTVGRISGGTIDRVDDVDLFRVLLTEDDVDAGVGFFQLIVDDARAELLVTIFDADEEVVASTVVGEALGSTADSASATIDWSLFSAGEYTILVRLLDAEQNPTVSAYELVTELLAGGDGVVDIAGAGRPDLALDGVPEIGAGETYFIRVESRNRAPTIYGLSLILDDGEVDRIDLGARGDLVRRDVIIGGAGDDRLSGGFSEDWIFGGQGNDVISGGLDRQASDLLFGGEGDDLFQLIPDGLPVIEATGETLIPTLVDRLDGGPGYDQVFFLGGDRDSERREGVGCRSGASGRWGFFELCNRASA